MEHVSGLLQTKEDTGIVCPVSCVQLALTNDTGHLIPEVTFEERLKRLCLPQQLYQQQKKICSVF
jgi:hypothetical protein